MNVRDSTVLAAIAMETQGLWEKIAAQYESEEDAPDRIAEFIIACQDAALKSQSEEPDSMELKYSKLSKEAQKQAKNRARNKRKAQRRARRENR